MYMTEETAKLTWHKTGKRYCGEDIMLHPSDAESWQYFDSYHRDKAAEARNVCVALATDGLNPYEFKAKNSTGL
jgi:hypothetical protein